MFWPKNLLTNTLGSWLQYLLNPFLWTLFSRSLISLINFLFLHLVLTWRLLNYQICSCNHHLVWVSYNQTFFSLLDLVYFCLYCNVFCKHQSSRYGKLDFLTKSFPSLFSNFFRGDFLNLLSFSKIIFISLFFESSDGILLNFSASKL